MPKEISVQKSIRINQPTKMVYDYVKYSKNMDHNSVCNMKDPNSKKEYTGEDGTVGFVYKWDSQNKNVGAGAQTTTDLKENELVEFSIQFYRPMENTGISQLLVKDLGDNSTELIWVFRGPTKFPMSLLKGIFEKMLGKDMEKSLQNLKGILEEK